MFENYQNPKKNPKRNIPLTGGKFLFINIPTIKQTFFALSLIFLILIKFKHIGDISNTPF